MGKRIKVHEKFEPLFEQQKGVRYYIITGGRGSGKSFAVNLWASIKTYEDNTKILFSRYTLTSAHISIIPEFKEKIELLEKEQDFEVKQSQIVNLTNGSELLFRGLKASSGNQTANLKSIHGLSVWILDEAEELVAEQMFDKVDFSIRKQEVENIVVLVLNPASVEHWIYKRFFAKKKIPFGFNGIIDDTYYIHTDYMDNIENLSDSFLRAVELIKQNNPSKYEHVFLGKFLEQNENAIFKREWFGSFDLSEITDQVVWNFGLDGAYTKDKANDPTVCLAYTVYKNCLYIRNIYREWQTITELTEKLPRWLNENGYTNQSIVYIEPKASGLSLIDTLRTYAGINTVKSYAPDKDKVVMANSIAPIVQAGRVLLNKRGSFMEVFMDEVLNFPNSKHDDQVDTMVMAIKNGITDAKKYFGATGLVSW